MFLTKIKFSLTGLAWALPGLCILGWAWLVLTGLLADSIPACVCSRDITYKVNILSGCRSPWQQAYVGQTTVMCVTVDVT